MFLFLEGRKQLQDILTECVPFSVETCFGIDCGVNQLSMKREAICDAFTIHVGTALINFE